MEASSRSRKQSKISQLVAPIVNITRKISRREKDDYEETKDINDDVDDVRMKITFVSQPPLEGSMW